VADARESAHALIEQLARILGEAGLDAVLIGGQAVNTWAEPRVTMDVDLTVVARGDAIRRAVEALQNEGFVLERLQDFGQASGPDFVRLIDSRTSLGLDIQVAKTEFEDSLLARAVRSAGQSLPVASPEDLIVMKLIANRSKDQKDLFDLGAREGIDWPYVERWAEVWQVADRLVSLRAALREDQERVKELFS